MSSTARTLLACALALSALALAGCGSSSSSSATSTSTSTPAKSTTSASATTTTPATTHAHVIKLTLPGSPTGTKGDLHLLVKLPRSPREVQKARISFLSGLSLDSQLEYLANQANSFWASEFQQAGAQLAPGAIEIILPGGSVACGSSQVTTSSAPEWCSDSDSVYLPYDYIQSNIAPNGNAATALVVFDMYGYHVEKAMGAFSVSPALSGVQLEELDSCLSGVWFGGLGPSYAQATDEQAVNHQLATDAAISQQFGANAAVSTSQLTTAFDDGAISQGNVAVCKHDA